MTIKISETEKKYDKIGYKSIKLDTRNGTHPVLNDTLTKG